MPTITPSKILSSGIFILFLVALGYCLHRWAGGWTATVPPVIYYGVWLIIGIGWFIPNLSRLMVTQDIIKK